MSSTTRRVLTSLTRIALNSGKLFHNDSTTVSRLGSVRPLALSAQIQARSKRTEDEPVNEPIKFSMSKASHRTWKVDGSMGSHYRQPVWKVLPISLLGICFLLWCALREPTDIDTQLEKSLYEHLPHLTPSEEDNGKDKPT